MSHTSLRWWATPAPTSRTSGVVEAALAAAAVPVRWDEGVAPGTPAWTAEIEAAIDGAAGMVVSAFA